MKEIYNDYPETYSENLIEKLSQGYRANKPKTMSFLNKFKEEKTMEKVTTLNNEPNKVSTLQTETREAFRLYSLISSNYCNLITYFDNIIAKTSSSKREIYQNIRASLIVDQERFNETFYTVCNSMCCNMNNYNQLIYTTIFEFIDLTENLSSLAITNFAGEDTQLVLRLRQNAYDMFRTFVGARPFRI